MYTIFLIIIFDSRNEKLFHEIGIDLMRRLFYYRLVHGVIPKTN